MYTYSFLSLQLIILDSPDPRPGMSPVLELYPQLLLLPQHWLSRLTNSTAHAKPPMCRCFHKRRPYMGSIPLHQAHARYQIPLDLKHRRIEKRTMRNERTSRDGKSAMLSSVFTLSTKMSMLASATWSHCSCTSCA